MLRDDVFGMRLTQTGSGREEGKYSGRLRAQGETADRG